MLFIASGVGDSARAIDVTALRNLFVCRVPSPAVPQTAFSSVSPRFSEKFRCLFSSNVMDAGCRDICLQVGSTERPRSLDTDDPTFDAEPSANGRLRGRSAPESAEANTEMALARNGGVRAVMAVTTSKISC